MWSNVTKNGNLVRIGGGYRFGYKIKCEMAQSDFLFFQNKSCQVSMLCTRALLTVSIKSSPAEVIECRPADET